MSRNISRRDFLNAVSLCIGRATLTQKTLLAKAISSSTPSTENTTYYPPALTGMRGSHQGSFEVAHELVWNGKKPESYQDLKEEYDLVIVGGGISGLASAFFYQQQAGKDQRILLLDNHDDFGGHAKRNEFHTQEKMLLGFGGSANLDHIEGYSDITMGLLKDLDIDLKKLDQYMDQDYPFANFDRPMGLSYNGKIVIGRWIAAFHGKGDYKKLINQLALTGSEKAKLIDFITGDKDYLSDMSLGEKLEYLSTTDYHSFLRDRIGLADSTLSLFDPFIRVGWGVGGDSHSVLEMMRFGSPGIKAVGELGKLTDELAFDENNIYHAHYFPDGNASIARLLVRSLIPAVAPGNSMEDIVAAKFDYSKLDRTESPVRIRLNSTAVNVATTDNDQVNVSYVSKDKAYRVKAKRCILACYNGIIPHLCPELPEAQKENLKYGVKVPFIWANILLRSGAPFYKAGAQFYQCANSHFELVMKAPPTTLNPANASTKPNDPLVVFMGQAPSPVRNGDETGRDLYRQGRHKLYTTPFTTYETQIREQLTEMFGPQGFDADRDIEAITVNRWSHGYAYEYMELFDSHIPEDEKPHILGRKQFGRISVANSDSQAHPYIDGAIDAAWRAVQEQLHL